MMTSDRNLILTRGYLIIKMGGTERAIKNPMVFNAVAGKPPVLEILSGSFMDKLKTMRVRMYTPEMLAGKTLEEKDLMMIELINS